MGVLNRMSAIKKEKYVGNGWIGVDLDGTLAHYDDWKGPEHIGEPIPRMLNFVKQWVQQGIPVKIFTARAVKTEYISYIEEWLEEHGLPDLEITNVKDFGMLRLYDDRCTQVITNTGQTVEPKDE